MKWQVDFKECLIVSVCSIFARLINLTWRAHAPKPKKQEITLGGPAVLRMSDFEDDFKPKKKQC